MGDLNIDWSAAPVERDYTAAALQGVDAGQHIRGVQALQGINLDDQSSLNKGIANLVRAGAADQASALMGLQLKRSAIALQPRLMAAIEALQNGGRPTAASDQAPAQGQQPDPQSAADLHTQVANDARAFSQTPPDQQPAMAAALKQKYLAKGIPEPAIDAALAHAATPGGADEIAGVHDSHATLANGGQLPPDAATAHGGTYSWTKSLLGNPALMMMMQNSKQYGGLDATGLIDTAARVAQPEIAAEATQAHAAPIARETFMGSNPTVPVMINGVKHDIPTEDALALYKNPSAIALGFGKGPELGQEAGAAAAATAPSHLTTLPGKGGTEQPGTFYPGKDGVWAFHPAQVASPTGGMTTAPATSSTGEKKAIEASNDQYQADRQLVAGSNNRLVVLKHVNDLLNSPQGGTGPGTQTVNGFRSFLLAQAPQVLQQLEGHPGEAQLKVATQDELHKYMVQLAGNAAAQYGQGTNEKLALAASGNANPDISTLANRDVTRLNIALERANQARLDAFQKTGQSGDHYADFSAKWGREVDPRAFMLDLLSKDEVAKLHAETTKDADRIAMVKGLNAAVAAGLFKKSDIKR